MCLKKCRDIGLVWELVAPGYALLTKPTDKLKKHQYFSFHRVILITLKALFLTALHFAFSASVPVTYSVLMNLLTTIPIVVTTKPSSQHKYSVPQTFLVLTHPKTTPTRTETTPFVIKYNPALPSLLHTRF